MTDSSRCTCFENGHTQCPKPVTYEKPLCYEHWKQFDSYLLFECAKCHRFSSDVNDYSDVRGYPDTVDWCNECFDRRRRGFPEAEVHNHGPVEHQTRYLYVLKLDGGKFYVGQTNALEFRLEEHRDGLTKSTAERTRGSCGSRSGRATARLSVNRKI